jgi:hypothetical protein
MGAMTEPAKLTEADREAILEPARDYIESWLDGDPDRMARCLHPELVKRSVRADPSGGDPGILTLSREQMVGFTAAGEGTRLERPYELSLLDVYGDIATVRLLSSVYMDYLHIARFGDRWLIVNVLWQDRPST